MDDAQITLVLIGRSIQQGDTQRLGVLLKRLPLTKISSDEADTLIVQLLSLTYKSTQGESAKLILTTWDAVHADDENWTLPAMTRLFLIVNFSDDMLTWIIGLFEDVTFMEIAQELIQYDADDTTRVALGRAVDLYNIPERDDAHILFTQLHKEAVATESIPAIELLASYMEDTAPFAEIPEWVHNYLPELPEEDELVVPQQPKPTFQLPDIETMVTQLTEGLEDYGLAASDIEEQKRVIQGQLATTTNEEKRILLEPILEAKNRENLADDVPIYRILGPANAMADINLADEGECCRYGGCRMFTCVHFEGDPDIPDEDQEDIDWFTGVCEECHLKIRVRVHAVRMPLIHGGWKGCYCSWKCVRQSLTQPDIAINAIIDRLERQLIRIGIQDRKARAV